METDQIISQQRQKTLKAVWNAKCHKIFIELCYEELLKGNKSRPSFNKNR